MLLKHCGHDLSVQLIQPADRAIVLKLDMNGTVVAIRSIIVQNQIIGTLYLGKGADSFFDFPYQFEIAGFSEQFGNCLGKHFKSCLDNHDGNDSAENCFQ